MKKTLNWQISADKAKTQRLSEFHLLMVEALHSFLL